MADYKEMYLKLFRSVSGAISLLQSAQAETEEMFISSRCPDITVLPPPGTGEPER